MKKINHNGAVKDIVHKKLQTRQEVMRWLDKQGILYYSINKDLSVDVSHNVNLSNRGLDFIPVKFNGINGNFYVNNNNLKDLSFCPLFVGENFNCSHNKLDNLNDCPKIVTGSFFCSNNKITEILLDIEVIGGDLYCEQNKLTSLQPLCDVEIKGIIYAYDEKLYLNSNNANDSGGINYVESNKIEGINERIVLNGVTIENLKEIYLFTELNKMQDISKAIKKAKI